MTPAKTYQDLRVWQSAHAFVIEVYACTRSFPKDELFGLTAQLRRSAVSVPSNIVEGFGRWSDKDKVKFYNIAEASLAEADYQLFLAQELNYSDTATARNTALDTKKLLAAFIKSIRP
ncbi:MAG: four helix bundle protein [Verrucomicrobiae bacterium]|nr:four helix bundle protein [Verrucomicrobiae bacterium]NNJ86673.1 four helix bundle protein [Akkermansiaceae bacterium]